MTHVFHMLKVWIIKAKVQSHETKLYKRGIIYGFFFHNVFQTHDFDALHEISFQDIFHFELNEARNKLSKELILAVMEKLSRSLTVRAELWAQGNESASIRALHVDSDVFQAQIVSSLYRLKNIRKGIDFTQSLV